MSGFRISNLGKYKIDRTEDYGWAKSTGEDLTYYEMIRVKGSKPSRYFTVPSHLYKYGERTLALYLKDHRRLWPQFARLLGQEIDISTEEVVFKFPRDRFNDVAKIIKLVRSSAPKKPISEEQKKKGTEALMEYRSKHNDLKGKSGDNLNENSLDDYLSIGETE